MKNLNPLSNFCCWLKRTKGTETERYFTYELRKKNFRLHIMLFHNFNPFEYTNPTKEMLEVEKNNVNLNINFNFC